MTVNSKEETLKTFVQIMAKNSASGARGILPERFLLTRLRISRERCVNINLTGKGGRESQETRRKRGRERMFMLECLSDNQMTSMVCPKLWPQSATFRQIDKQ